MLTEPTRKPQIPVVLTAVILVCGLLAILLPWYRRTHPPYKWPVIPPYTTIVPSPNAYDIYNDAHMLVKDRDIAGRECSNSAPRPGVANLLAIAAGQSCIRQPSGCCETAAGFPVPIPCP